jgi:hypothetical protein
MQPERLATSSKCDGDRRSLYEKSVGRKRYLDTAIIQQAVPMKVTSGDLCTFKSLNDTEAED